MRVSAFLVPQSVSFESKSQYRTVIILEPFERGFGHTIGNAFRRVLLSSLTGCAITEVKIEGALHEYAVLEGVQEDVLDILLNLRGLAFTLQGDRDEIFLELKKSGSGPVCAGDIELPHDIKIVNPDHVIANVTQAREFNMVLKLERGRGEQGAASHKDQEEGVDVGTLYLDAVFNPVRRVSYTVDRDKLDKSDQLIIDLETNGAITPEAAIRQAALILREQLNMFLKLKRPDDPVSEAHITPIDPFFIRPISDLGLSHRAANCLKAEGMYYIGDLVTKTEAKLLETPSLGKKSLEEIKEALKPHTLMLGVECSGWPPPDLVYPDVENETTEQ